MTEKDSLANAGTLNSIYLRGFPSAISIAVIPTDHRSL